MENIKDLTAYKKRFDEDPSTFNDFQAMDYVKELKKQGKDDEAIEVGRTFMQVSPELTGYINHYGYALYNKFINIDESAIKEKESLFYSILDEIVKICKQERFSPVEASVNKAIKYVMNQSTVDYKKLSDLLDLLDVKALDDKPFINKEGKEFESKKEKWFRLKIRALYELEDYKDCLEQTNIAFALPIKWHYNNLNWAKYYRGCSLVKIGRYEEAENEFLSLKGRMKNIDFSSILYKLYVNTDRVNEAYTHLIYEFFLNGFDYHLLDSYKDIKDMATAKENKKVCELAEALVKKLSDENNKSYETSIDLSAYDQYDASSMYDRLYNELMEHLDSFIEREEGKVVYYNQDKQFGSIYQEDEDNLFFRQSDYIYDEEVMKNDVVEYSTIKTFDTKKQVATTKAILIKTLYEDISY